MNKTAGQWMCDLREDTSLRTIGKKLGFSHIYLSNVELGKRPMSYRLAKGLDQLFDLKGELVALAEKEVIERWRQ